MTCYKFPDIWLDLIPAPADKDSQRIRKEEKERRARVYAATLSVLTNNFCVHDVNIPVHPQDFEYDTDKADSAKHPATAKKYKQDILEMASIIGLLLGGGWEDPSMGKTKPVDGDLEAKTWDGNPFVADRRFVDAVVAAVKEYTAYETVKAGTVGLFARTFDLLVQKADRTPQKFILTEQIANIVRRLVELEIRAEDPQVADWVENAFAMVLGGSVIQRTSQIHIDLPNIEDDAQADIIKDNVLAVSALYFAAQLEELKFFAVADKVAEQFEGGMVPMSRGPGGDAIYKYIKSAINRLTEADRRSIYARAFGFAQGSVDEPMPNREFADLWIRFLSAVSILSREDVSTRAFRATITEPQATKNARDLAVNISLHGYGIGYSAAIELQDTIKTIKKMLSYPDVLSAYGVVDVWQLVERVSAMSLGGSVNSVRQRTLATTGQKIIQWLADQQQILVKPGASLPLAKKEIVEPVERWLAVTGTDDQSTMRYSEPISIPQQPTIPAFPFQQSLPPALQQIVPQVTNGGVQGAFAQLPNLGAPAKA
jgi:hypothetical protein